MTQGFTPHPIGPYGTGMTQMGSDDGLALVIGAWVLVVLALVLLVAAVLGDDQENKP